MQQIDIERSQEFRKCIECFLCQDVCHVMRDHEENKTSYAGPRFFIRSAELEMHPLDTNDRRELLQHNQGLGMCNITKCCTEVCPEHIKITDNAIIPLKERVVDATYDPIAWLGRKIRNRRAPRTPSEAAATAPSTGPAAVQPSPEVHGIPEPDTDRPQPYWESGLTETDAQTTTVVPDGLDGCARWPDGCARRTHGRSRRTGGRWRRRQRLTAQTALVVAADGHSALDVPRFLTSAWVDAFNQAVASVTLPTPGADAGLVPQSGSFIVAQEVRGAADGDVTLLLRFDDGKLKLALASGADENGDMGDRTGTERDDCSVLRRRGGHGQRRAQPSRGPQRRPDPGPRGPCRTDRRTRI